MKFGHDHHHPSAPTTQASTHHPRPTAAGQTTPPHAPNRLEDTMTRWGFCDRCGVMTEFPCWKVNVCYPCELGMNSIAAMLDPRWARPMTSREIWLAHQWALIEHGQPVSAGADVPLPQVAS